MLLKWNVCFRLNIFLIWGCKKIFLKNIKLVKKNNQKGIGLFVWIQHKRAILFCKNSGFKSIGTNSYPIADNETIVNHLTYLEF